MFAACEWDDFEKKILVHLVVFLYLLSHKTQQSICTFDHFGGNVCKNGQTGQESGQSGGKVRKEPKTLHP